MANAWIEHVKRFQQAHGCSYKDALQGASASYSKGGNIIKTAKSAGKTLINAGTARAVRAINGSGVNRLKKAQRWEHFADSTLHDAIDTANKARKTYQKSGFGLKKHKRLSGRALLAAGY
jgi:hypothetical protein